MTITTTMTIITTTTIEMKMLILEDVHLKDIKMVIFISIRFAI